MPESKPVCRYDPRCYRRNKDHLANFSHPAKDAADRAAAAAATASPAKAKATTAAAVIDVDASPTSTPSKKTKKRHFDGPLTRSSQLTSPRHRSPEKGMATATAKRDRSPHNTSPVRSPSNHASAHTASSPTRQRGETPCDFSFAPPAKPRPSPLSGTNLNEVYEMPFPVSQMKAVVAVAKLLNPDRPLDAFPGVRLVGPFEVLVDGKKFASDAEKWSYMRFRYDCPEVQTVAVSVETVTSTISRASAAGDTTTTATSVVSTTFSQPKFHLCLHRDDPKLSPSMCVIGRATEPNFDVAGLSIGTSLAEFIVRSTSGVGARTASGSSSSAAAASTSPSAPALDSALIKRALAALEKEFGERDAADAKKKRRKESLTTTFNGLGVRVPYDKRTEVGYREMVVSRRDLQAMLDGVNNRKLSPRLQDDLEEQLRLADIANDECDFGLNIELGLNFWSNVRCNNSVLWHTHRILDMAYMLLERELFRHILQCHLRVLAGLAPPLLQ